MGEHFANNFIINILHVTARSGTDEWLSARIGIVQGVSFFLALTCCAAVLNKAKTGIRLS